MATPLLRRPRATNDECIGQDDGPRSTDAAKATLAVGQARTGGCVASEPPRRIQGSRTRPVRRAAMAVIGAAVVVVLVAVTIAGPREADDVAPVSDLVSAAMEATAPVPLVSFDGVREVSSRLAGSNTIVEMADRVTGSTASINVPGRWEAVVADYPGERVALMPDLGDGRTIYEPGGRLESRIAVVTWSDRQQVVTYDVPGNVVPEAFSHDPDPGGGLDALFVIDHRPALEPASYRVRAMPLAGGPLGEVLGPDKTGPVEDMRGVGREQVVAPDGRQLYTYYSRQVHRHENADGAHEHRDGSSRADGFVHVLDLQAAWAYCLDLPEVYGDGPPSATAIAISPRGDQISVVDTWAGEAAIIETAPLRAATRTGTVVPEIARHPLSPDLDRAEDLTATFTAEGLIIEHAGQGHSLALP